jgi:glycerol-3-phosphate dehydrogenase (NAD(P)+)
MPPSPDRVIAVLGAGSWGTALALLLTRNGHRVRLWGHDPAHVERLAGARENREFLPGFPLPPELSLSADLEGVVRGASELLLVVPSHAFAAVLRRLAASVAPGVGVSWATKGFEPESGRLLHEVAAETLGNRCPLAAISGPTFAREVAQGLPTAVAVASDDMDHARRVADYLHSERFRAYTNGDLVGVQAGGAAKNVLAIAAGIADGLGFGANTRAALITRGLKELMRFGVALGGRADTFMGLAGLGDLALTCTDDQSRNRRLGLLLAKGLGLREARAAIGQEVEGVGTTRVVHLRASALGVQMPISEQVYRVLYEGSTPAEATHALLERSSKGELD